MRYPEFLKVGYTIGLIAPSFGVSGHPYEERYQNAKRKFTNLGYKLVECESINNLSHCRSNTAEKRAKEFMDMYLDPKIDFIISVAGGELMCEILPYINFERIRFAKPKFVMGYSDNTNLTFTLPVLADVAAIYGSNFGSFGMASWDKSLQEAYEVITEKRKGQDNYTKYELVDLSKEKGNELASYNLTEKVEYKVINGEDEFVMNGRLIGGCIECLTTLCGSEYGNTRFFLEKYKKDGFIWFLESCDFDVVGLSRVLWQLKNNGWFDYCNGIIFGRMKHPEEVMEVTLEEAISTQLKDLGVPIIYEADFGHLPPSWTIISGALARIEYRNKKCSIDYILE